MTTFGALFLAVGLFCIGCGIECLGKSIVEAVKYWRDGE